MSIFRAAVGIVLVVALSGCAAAPGSGSGASARRDSGRPGDRGLRSVPTGATYDGSQPFVISGSPQRDTEAYRSASDALEEADWQVLEQYGPRNMWSNLFDKQDRLQDRRQERSAPVEPPPLALVPAVKPRTVPQVVRLDGQVQIYYRLWHYGGAGVKNARKHGYDLPAIEVNDGVLDPLVKIVQNYLGEKGTVEPLPSENMLVITCDPPMQSGVMQLLQNIDTSRRQVQITVRIFEVSDDFDFQFGVRTVLKHLSATDSQAFLGNFDAASFAGKAIDPFNAIGPNPGSVMKLVNTFGNSGVSLDVTFQALEETGLVKVVSSPRMTVAAGEPAFMMAGQELPIREGRISNDKFVTEKISYKPIGVQLYITPQAIGDHSVKLHLLTIVSAISGFAPLPTINEHKLDPSIVNPIIDSRQAETRVEVPHGSTLVFGGLRMVRRVAREEKVPFLGDAPIIGWLMKNQRSQRQLSDLYFFVTPRLVG